MVHVSLVTHGLTLEGSGYVSLQRPSYHFLNALLLHLLVVFLNEVRHVLFPAPELLLVGRLVLDPHVYERGRHLGGFHVRSSTPVNVGLIVGSRSNEARVVQFCIESVPVLIALGSYFVRSVLSLVGGSEITRDFVGHFDKELLVI